MINRQELASAADTIQQILAELKSNRGVKVTIPPRMFAGWARLALGSQDVIKELEARGIRLFKEKPKGINLDIQKMGLVTVDPTLIQEKPALRVTASGVEGVVIGVPFVSPAVKIDQLKLNLVNGPKSGICIAPPIISTPETIMSINVPRAIEDRSGGNKLMDTFTEFLKTQFRANGVILTGFNAQILQGGNVELAFRRQ